MFKYKIIQEDNNTKAKLTYEFTANNEDEMVEELNCFMSSIGFAQSGYLSLVQDDDSLYDDIDSEVQDSFNFGKPEINPEIETYKNFEFPFDNNMYEEGQGQTEYTFVSNDADKIAENSKQLSSTWPFPLDRPSQPTFRVDSIYVSDNANVSYGA
jgi:hypothetical protein